MSKGKITNRPTEDVHSAGLSRRAIIYTRFSPRRSAEDCQSCAWQAAECEQFAHDHGYNISQVFDDPDVSGADAVRPTLWSAIDYLTKGDTLLVWKWDRLARDLILALQIERAVEVRGAKIIAISGDVPGNDPQAVFTRHILMAVSELERMMIRQRTSASMRALQKSGRKMSKRLPWGYVQDPNDPKRMIVDENEMRIKGIILKMREDGKSFRGIAKELDRLCVHAKIADHWNECSVRAIIRRELPGRLPSSQQ